MSSYSFNRRPTEIEDQAHVEAVQHFAEQLKQFPASRDAVKRLERDIAKIALAILAASRRPLEANPIVTDDGSQWHNSVGLFDNVFVCHRQTINGPEYAVVERFPSGTNEIWNRGRNVVDVLKAFTHDQRQALQIWTEDTTAQLKEFLAEKYPGHDMSRVSESFLHRFTHAETQTHQQRQSRGIRV
jgi:hypothetical protein